MTEPGLVLPRASRDLILELRDSATPPEDRLCFLVLAGSFNPVHNQHLAMVEDSLVALETRGWRVVVGFLAPSSDEYVRGKAGPQALPLDERVRLCRLAAASSERIGVCDAGELSGYRAAGQLRGVLMRQLGGRTITGIEIMGSDTLARLMTRLIEEWEAISRESREPWYRDRHVFCIDRPPAAGQTESISARERISRRVAEFGVIVTTPDAPLPDRGLRDLSASAIRELMEKADWPALEASGWLHPDVIAALRSSGAFATGPTAPGTPRNEVK